MTTQQTFDAMFEDKLKTLMPYLVSTARGDEDLIQEGAIEIWESMVISVNPNATPAFFKEQVQNLKAFSDMLDEKEPNQRILKSDFVGYIPSAQSIMARSSQAHIHTSLDNNLFGVT